MTLHQFILFFLRFGKSLQASFWLLLAWCIHKVDEPKQTCQEEAWECQYREPLRPIEHTTMAQSNIFNWVSEFSLVYFDCLCHVENWDQAFWYTLIRRERQLRCILSAFVRWLYIAVNWESNCVALLHLGEHSSNWLDLHIIRATFLVKVLFGQRVINCNVWLCSWGGASCTVTPKNLVKLIVS